MMYWENREKNVQLRDMTFPYNIQSNSITQNHPCTNGIKANRHSLEIQQQYNNILKSEVVTYGLINLGKKPSYHQAAAYIKFSLKNSIHCKLGEYNVYAPQT